METLFGETASKLGCDSKCFLNVIVVLSKVFHSVINFFKLHSVILSKQGKNAELTLAKQFENTLNPAQLDGKYRTIKSLTYMTIGSYTDVDTTMFRVAVMHYIQCLFGIRHDDYDYGQINELLARYVMSPNSCASFSP